MNKNELNYWIDIGLVISFFICFVTGVIKFRDLWLKLGIDSSNLYFKSINSLHDLSGMILGMLVIIHLILHWKWLIVMTKKRIKGKL